MKLFLYW